MVYLSDLLSDLVSSLAVTVASRLLSYLFSLSKGLVKQTRMRLKMFVRNQFIFWEPSQTHFWELSVVSEGAHNYSCVYFRFDFDIVRVCSRVLHNRGSIS